MVPDPVDLTTRGQPPDTTGGHRRGRQWAEIKHRVRRTTAGRGDHRRGIEKPVVGRLAAGLVAKEERLALTTSAHRNKRALTLGLRHLVAHPLIAAPIGEDWPIQIPDEVYVTGAGRAHHTHGEWYFALVDGKEAGHPVLDMSLVDHVGRLNAHLG